MHVKHDSETKGKKKKYQKNIKNKLKFLLIINVIYFKFLF